MKNTLTAAVILIGNELLSGSIEDKNLAHIAKTLEVRGIRVRETRIIPDIESEIVDAINTLRVKHDYVFTTGGIGPTHDDITSDSIATAFGVKNVIVQDVFDSIQAYLNGKGIEFTLAAQRMAHAPEGAEMIHADDSIIPGYRIENVFVMAGVPRIMRHMLGGIINHLKTGLTIHNAYVHANVGEGEIASALEAVQNQHPDIDIGSYPQDKGSTISDYRVVFVVKGTDLQEIELTCQQILSACHSGGYDAIKI
ncbi:MAG: molybdenum cofactor synthesis domain-containing protein [Arenicella sp.]|jgi:molybdenum cofactor synthesis domain-containing protein